MFNIKPELIKRGEFYGVRCKGRLLTYYLSFDGYDSGWWFWATESSWVNKEKAELAYYKYLEDYTKKIKINNSEIKVVK